MFFDEMEAYDHSSALDSSFAKQARKDGPVKREQFREFTHSASIQEQQRRNVAASYNSFGRVWWKKSPKKLSLPKQD